MSRLVLWPLLAAVLAGGCKRHEPASGSAAGQSSSTAYLHGSGLTSEPASNGVVIAADNTDEVLRELTLALRRYVVHARSVPRSFEEFAAKASVQAPPPPAGKKYAIQGHEVVLVKP